MNNVKRILKLIDSHEIISFDIFDTLLKRDVQKPTDLFLIVQNRYNKMNDVTIHDFATNRILAEKNARIKQASGEVTIDEIYDNYEGISKKQKEVLKEIEFVVEKDYCRQNKDIKYIYEYCKKYNKKVIAVSDMYLSKKQIKELLELNSFEVDDIFVSNEFRACKKTGELFEKVLNTYKVSPSKILHIGDSYKADFMGPLIKKIRPLHIDKIVNKMHFWNYKKLADLSISNNIYLSTINNTIDKDKDYFYKIGYEICGPIFANFIFWLDKTAKENNIDNLLFCARDMKLVQEIYDLLNDKTIKNSYFYVSRKSTYLPYLYVNNSYPNFKNLIPVGSRKYKINDLLHLFSIDQLEEKVLKKYDIDIDKKYTYNELINSKGLEELYNKVISEEIKMQGKKQYEYFMNYLKKLNVGKKTSIVDLGWRGTTQKMLIDILKYNINGMYFGITERDEKYLTTNCYTYLFDGLSTKISRKVYSSLSLIELIFSALHGSTLLYSNNQDAPYVLGECTNKNSKVIVNIQDGIKDFCIEIKKHIQDVSYEKTNYFEERFLDICTNPTLNDAKMFGDLNTENIVERHLASPKSLIYYLFHIKQFKNDFIDSEYKIGFMKRLLKIKLNYFAMYEFLKKNR